MTPPPQDAGTELEANGGCNKPGSSLNPDGKKSSSPCADRSNLLERLYHISGLQVTSVAAKRGCDRALTQMVESHLQAPMIKELLAKAFAGECGSESTGKKPARTPGRTPGGLWSKGEVGRIISAATGVHLSKAHLLIQIGTELEKGILQKLPPKEIRQMICKGLDVHEALNEYLAPRRREITSVAEKSNPGEPKTMKTPAEPCGPPV